MTDLTDLIIVLGIALVVLAAWGLVVAIRSLTRFLNRIPVVKDFAPEAPTIPKTVRKAMSARERIDSARRRAEARKAWAYQQDVESEIYDLIGDVREGDHRG